MSQTADSRCGACGRAIERDEGEDVLEFCDHEFCDHCGASLRPRA